MDIEWFNSFLEVSRLKSVSKASQLLNITQPALSKQIHNLENYYGVELFKRSPQGVELTEEGQLFENRIRLVLNELESIKKDILNLSHLTSFRLGVFPSIAAYYLPKAILEFKQLGVQVEMSVFNTSTDILQALQMDSIDVGIIQKQSSLPNIYWLKDLFTESFRAVIPENHPFYDRNALSVSDLAEESLIVFPKQCDTRRRIQQAFQHHHLIPKFGLEVDFSESIIGFVKAGAGITILPEITTSQISGSSIRALPIEDFMETRTLSLVTQKQALGKKVYQVIKNTETKIPV